MTTGLMNPSCVYASFSAKQTTCRGFHSAETHAALTGQRTRNVYSALRDTALNRPRNQRDSLTLSFADVLAQCCDVWVGGWKSDLSRR